MDTGTGSALCERHLGRAARHSGQQLGQHGADGERLNHG